jgi:hypothetical protein
MSAAAGVQEVYSALEESSRLLNVSCSRDDVQPILTTYADALPEAVIVFSMATGKTNDGELDYSITVPSAQGDPYALALLNGLTTETDHPVGTLLSDIEERCPIGGYAIDCGVVGGFKKTYAFFPTDDLQGVSKLGDIPSMPRSLAENAGFFTRYGLDDKVSMLSIDYQNRTVNLYFGKLPAECLESKTILSMIHDVGLPEPGEETLEFTQKSFAIYVTLSWDSPEIERICFAVITQDPMALPARIEPDIAQFAKSAPHAYAGERTLVYGITLAPSGEYYKLGSYYQINAQTRKLLVAFDAIKDEA